MNWNWARFLQTLSAIAALLIAAGLVALGVGGLDALKARRVADWPSVSGRVVASESVTMPFRGRAIRYAPGARIAYEYAVDGVVFTSEQVGVEARPVEAGSEEGRRRLREYPPGAVVTVYYDPADPTRAILERAAPVVAFSAGAWLIGLGLAVAAARWLLRRRSYSQPET